MTAALMERDTATWRYPEAVRGWLAKIEGETLRDLAAGRDVLEIGSYCGKSAICMAQVANVVHTVDWHKGDDAVGEVRRSTLGPDNSLDLLNASLHQWGLTDKVVVHVGRSADILAGMKADGRKFDLAFIDGAHDEESVAADIAATLPLLRPDAVIAFHDWDSRPSVREAVRRFWHSAEGEQSLRNLMWRPAADATGHPQVEISTEPVAPPPMFDPFTKASINGHAATEVTPAVAFLAVPNHDGRIHAATAASLYMASKKTRALLHFENASLLSYNFNRLYSEAFNLDVSYEKGRSAFQGGTIRDSNPFTAKNQDAFWGYWDLGWLDAEQGHTQNKITHFCMCHSDIAPDPFWLDVLVAEQRRLDADVVSAVSPIKDGRGLTSTGYMKGDILQIRRFTMYEILQFPETFDNVSCGHPDDHLMVNSGCWVMPMGRPWAKEFPGFTIRDALQVGEDGMMVPQVISEDWNFSHWLAEKKLKVYATRKVRLAHWGGADFRNDCLWGGLKTDEMGDAKLS